MIVSSIAPLSTSQCFSVAVWQDGNRVSDPIVKPLRENQDTINSVDHEDRFCSPSFYCYFFEPWSIAPFQRSTGEIEPDIETNDDRNGSGAGNDW